MTGTELRSKRLAAGLSLRQLARVTGVHWTTIWRWETGRHPVPAWMRLVFKAIKGEQ